MAKRVVFLDRATLADTVRLPHLPFEHNLICYDATHEDQIAERIANAAIVITNKARLSEAAIARAPHLALIAVAATGYDCVDVAAAHKRGISVTNIRDYAGATVPEHVFALLLSLRRSLFAYRRSVSEGAWQRAGQFCYFDHPVRDLNGSTLGIFGGGAIGMAVARLGEAFGMRVLIAARKSESVLPPGRVAFETVLRESDAITVHVPLNAQTHHLFDADVFAQMDRHPIFINTARGPVVDETALVAAVERGQIAAAGIDVVSVEPPPADHRLMVLAARDNVILTPHIGWSSAQAMQALADQLGEVITAFVAGAPRNLVTERPDRAP